MRVLWLVLAQLPAVVGQASMSGGGWLEGLRGALQIHEPRLELGIVAPGARPRAPFTVDNATYFTVSVDQSRLSRAVDAWGLGSLPEHMADATLDTIREFRPDLVHVHGTENMLGLAAIRSGVPAVATLQGFATVCERFTLDALPASEIGRNTLSRSALLGHGLLANHLSMRRRANGEREIVRGIDHFIGQTDWDRTVLEMLHPGARYHRTECIVQQVFYDAEPWSPPRGAGATVYCTGGAAPYKGMEMLVEALGVLRRAGRSDISLRVAGSVLGSPMWSYLSRLARRNKVDGQIAWLGTLPPAQLAEELRSASVFVLPSHIENQPNALIEAMLCGVPCVAAAVGGVPELLRHGLDGLLYQDRDPFALAGAIDRVIGDEDLARSLGSAARESALTRYDRETIAHTTAAVYDELLSDSKAGKP
jgi:glycosyltransferase involved in cell wall biosynthesis